MFCVKNRIFCDACNRSHIANNYPNHKKSQGRIKNVLKNRCTNSMILKTHFIKKQTKTELVNIIANEAIYQLQNYENLYVVLRKFNKRFLVPFSATIFCLVAIHIY